LTERTPVFELHIRPMFRGIDRDHMRFSFDLWDYDQVRDNADGILARLETDMPTEDTGGPWPDEWVRLFARWMQTGFGRLHLGTAEYALVPAATAVTVRATGTYPAAGFRGWLETESETETAKTYVLYFEPPPSPVDGEPQSFSLRERYPASDTRSVFVRDGNGVQELRVVQPPTGGQPPPAGPPPA
jgi:hypothetical protein